jgi:hypothetical protein
LLLRSSFAPFCGGARRGAFARSRSCAIRTRKVIEKKRKTAGQDVTWECGSPKDVVSNYLSDSNVLITIGCLAARKLP